MADPSKRQAYLIAVWVDGAVLNLDKALQVAEHTKDIRLIAKVRDVRDRARSIREDLPEETDDGP